MRLIRLLLLLGIAVGIYQWHDKRSAARALAAAQSEYGFVDLPPATTGASTPVVVVAAQNCPEDAAQRADRLADDLSRQGVPVCRVEKTQGIDTREVHAVAQQPVGVGVGARRERRSVDARHRRIHRMMPGEDDTAPAERSETRHDVGGDVVGPQGIDDDEQVATRGCLGRHDDAQAGEQRRNDSKGSKGCDHAADCLR